MNLVFFLQIFLVLFSASVQAEPSNTSSVPQPAVAGIAGGVFQNAFRWVAFDHMEKGTLLFFDPQMTPILKFSNVGKFVDFRIDKSLLNIPLLEIDFERCYSKNNQSYKAIVSELFEIHGDKLHRIYSYIQSNFFIL